MNVTFDANQSIGGNGANAISGMSNGGAGGTALYSGADIQNGTSTNTIFANSSDIGGSGGSGFGGGSNGGNGNLVGTLSATVASYNLFFNNVGGNGFTGTNAIIGTDPLFVNPPSDLHLRSASPAKGAGNSTGAPSVDLDNNPRPFTPTIGAYELGNFLKATGGIGRVTITWAGVDGASSYNLYYISGGGTVTLGSTKISGVTSPYVFGPVVDGTTWSFALTAVESSVEGPTGPQATATVSGGPGGPWISAATTGTNWTSIARDLANGNTLYATATDSVGLYKSTDAGDSWTPLTGPFNGFGMHAAAANGSTVLVAGMGAIYRSINGGTTWTTSFSGAGIGEDYVNGLAIDPLSTSTVYAADFHIDFGTTSSYLVIKSTDGGATFHNLQDLSTANLRGYFLQVDPVTSGTLYAAGSGVPNIGKSANNGGTWTSVSPHAGYPTALALAPNLIVRLYAGMKDIDNTTVLGIYRSNNGGSSWTPINTGLGGGVINALFVDPANADHVHAGASDGYYVSTDGTNWNAGAAGAGSHFINAFAQTTTRRLIATTSNSIIIMLPLDAAPTINANPGSGTTDGGDVVTVSGSGFTVATGLRVLFGGVDGCVNFGTSTSTSITVTTPIDAPGSVDVAVINPDGQAAIRTNAFTYNCSVATISPVSANYSGASASGTVQVIISAGCGWTASAPGGSFVTITGGSSGTGSGTVSYNVAGNLTSAARSTTLTIAGISFTVTQSASGTPPMVLTHTTSSGQVSLSWSASGGGTYEVRRSNNGGAFNLVTATGGTTFNDTTVTNGVGYLYQIYAINGGVVSYSNINIAVPFNYTDASLSGVVIKVVHFTEPQQAVNAGRVALGWPAFNFTDASLAQGMVVQGDHLATIRARINEVRAAVGTSAVSFTDPTLMSGVTVIKAIHILEVRGGL